MDLFNVISIVLSVAALVVAVTTGVRQIRLAHGSTHLPVVLGAFQHSQTPAWFQAQQYVLTTLAAEHDPACGWRDLPDTVREQVNIIGLFYDDLGKLAAHRMIDERLIIGAYGTPIVHLWDVLAPYVYTERRNHGLHFWIYFEHLAARTATIGPDRVYAALRLRSRPPTVHPRSAEKPTDHA